jgi:hypothetical protein
MDKLIEDLNLAAFDENGEVSKVSDSPNIPYRDAQLLCCTLEHDDGRLNHNIGEFA